MMRLRILLAKGFAMEKSGPFPVIGASDNSPHAELSKSDPVISCSVWHLAAMQHQLHCTVLLVILMYEVV